ncbi:hypothetical protein HDU76_006151 [Blyttiomyces sp. JEL0837]|nr:hypothetical protein HDU76_006151 [Blyttiomyces sp. JEL0837]
MQVIKTLLFTAAIAAPAMALNFPPVTLGFADANSACLADISKFVSDTNTCIPGFIDTTTGSVNTSINPTADQVKCICAGTVSADVSAIQKDCTDPQALAGAKQIQTALSQCPAKSGAGLVNGGVSSIYAVGAAVAVAALF